MTDKTASTNGRVLSMATTVKSAFPLLQVPNIANTTSALTVAGQIFLAAYVARRYHPIISIRHVLFCVLYPTYLLLANHLRFENNAIVRQRPKDHPHSASELLKGFFSASNAAWFQRYMCLAAVVGLVLPLVTVSKAPQDVARLAMPHLFVLWCQIVGESATVFNPYVHRYIATLNFVGFSVYRMNLLAEWFSGSVALYVESSGFFTARVWGLALSGLNLVFWTYNLFVMILLRILPEYLSDEKCESAAMRISLPFIKEEQGRSPE